MAFYSEEFAFGTKNFNYQVGKLWMNYKENAQ